MSRKRHGSGGPPGRSGPGHEAGEPDMIADVRRMLALPSPYEFLVFASTVLASLEPARSPFDQRRDEGVLGVAEVVGSFLDIDARETTALLTVFAELLADEVLSARIRRELSRREHALPGWLTGLAPVEAYRAVRVSHVLGDGDTVVLGVRTASGAQFSVAVYIDHNLGTVVKDAFVVDAPIDETAVSFRDAASDPDVQVNDLDLADARVMVVDAVEVGRLTYPPFESDTWPGCRPVVEWVSRSLPTGGRGYARPVWSDMDREDLAERFFASPFGRAHDDTDGRGMLESVLWFGCDYGPGDPLRWSPVAVEILLTDWLPRKVVADVEFLARAPQLLRGFIRFCHSQRGIREALTAETLAAVDKWEPDYQQAIRSPRPQGPAALLAAMGLGGPWDDLSEVVEGPAAQFARRRLERLGAAVGGQDVLSTLETSPLPDEEFAWAAVPSTGRVGEVLALIDRVCGEVLDVEYRTAARRLLADVAAADPEIFDRGQVNTAAAAILWIVGKANDLSYEGGLTVPVGDLLARCAISGSPAQRARTMLAALGIARSRSAELEMGTPRYLVSERRQAIARQRDLLKTNLED